MNLLCPNCQKMLTVPDQFAGQLMKCPLCAGTFNVPGLPAASEPIPFAPPQPPPPAPLAPPTPAPSASAETYGLQPEATPPAPVPSAPQVEKEPVPVAPLAPEPPTGTMPPSATEPLTTPSVGYQKSWAVRFNPTALRWVAAVAVVLIFLSQFFPWVGVYPGGVGLYHQNAWQAAFDSVSVDDSGLEKTADDLFPKNSFKSPGVSVLSIFYLLLFIPTLLITVAAFVVDLMAIKLPASLQSLYPWRWGIAGALNLFVFLFFVLQLLIGYSIESAVRTTVDSRVKEISAIGVTTNTTTIAIETNGQKQKEVLQGMLNGTLHRTGWLVLAFVLHLLAILGTLIVFRAGQNQHRPVSRLALEW